MVGEECAPTSGESRFLADLDHEYMVPGVVPASGFYASPAVFTL
jgi:hypothetical protein